MSNMWPDERRPWYGSFVFSQAESLRQLGVELDVVYIPGYRSRAEYLRAPGAVYRAVRAKAYDVVHAHYGHSAVVGRCETGVPLVISYCGDDLLGTPTGTQPGQITPLSRMLAATFAQCSRLAAATITKSEEMARRLPRSAQHRNHVIPNGVDLERFAPGDQAEAQRTLGWAEQLPNLLFVGNPALPRKNFALAEAVGAELARRGRPTRLRVAWDIGPDQIPLWLNAADVLLFPSLSEGSPNAVKEAMAVGLPVVSAAVGDVPERLRGVPGGFVVDRDVHAMADAVLAALDVGRSAEIREAVLPLSIERVAERVAAVYRDVSRR